MSGTIGHRLTNAADSITDYYVRHPSLTCAARFELRRYAALMIEARDVIEAMETVQTRDNTWRSRMRDRWFGLHTTHRRMA